MTGEDAHLEAQYEDANGSGLEEPADEYDGEEHEHRFYRSTDTNEDLPCECGADPEEGL